MKKHVAVILALLLLLAGLAGCASGKGASDTDDGRIRIVTTIFPAYDWVRNVLGDETENVELFWLLDDGVDMHSFQPSAEDILTISTCDLFVYVGGESDRWASDVLKNAMNKEMKVVSLLDALGEAAKTEETVEGMQEEHGEGEEPGGEEYDEHVWLSLRNAGLLVSAIGEAAAEADGVHADIYRENAREYVARLDALDGEYEAAVTEASRRTLLFGDRFPFRYLTDDYGLSYYAAFAGCSAETEASFETVTFLAEKADELGLSVVLTIEGTDHRIAETIVQNTETKDQRILVMDSMQSVTGKDAAAGTTYLSIMERNLDVLKEALK